MKPADVLAQSREQIRALAMEHGVVNPRFLGSVLQCEDSELSNLDVPVDPTPSTHLLDIATPQYAALNP
jgi:predicted nucleotidyltransferase